MAMEGPPAGPVSGPIAGPSSAYRRSLSGLCFATLGAPHDELLQPLSRLGAAWDWSLCRLLLLKGLIRPFVAL